MKKFRTKLITVLTVLTLAITAMPMESITAEAATKPAKVTKITKVKATETSLKIKIKKVKKAKGYQVRVTKAGKSKVLKSVRTKNTTVTIKGLTPNTKYKLKVRAYTKSGKKYVYGKEKSISYKTLKKKTATTTPTPTPTPTPVPTPQPTPEPELPEDYNIKYPGESTNTGDALLADYNAFKAYVVSKVTADMTENEVWNVISTAIADNLTYPHAHNYPKYNNAYTTLLDMYKYNAGSVDAYADLLADIYAATGRKIERVEGKYLYERYGYTGTDANWSIVYTDKTNVRRLLKVSASDDNKTVGFVTTSDLDYDKLREDRRIVTNCPVCNTQMEGTNQIECLEDFLTTIDCPNCGIPSQVDTSGWEQNEIPGRPYCVTGIAHEARYLTETCPHCNNTVTSSYPIERLLNETPGGSTTGCKTGCTQTYYWLNPYYNSNLDPKDVPINTVINTYKTREELNAAYRELGYIESEDDENTEDNTAEGTTDETAATVATHYANIICPQCSECKTHSFSTDEVTSTTEFWCQCNCNAWTYFENPYYGTTETIPEDLIIDACAVDANGAYPEFPEIIPEDIESGAYS